MLCLRVWRGLTNLHRSPPEVPNDVRDKGHLVVFFSLIGFEVRRMPRCRESVWYPTCQLFFGIQPLHTSCRGPSRPQSPYPNFWLDPEGGPFGCRHLTGSTLNANEGGWMKAYQGRCYPEMLMSLKWWSRHVDWPPEELQSARVWPTRSMEKCPSVGQPVRLFVWGWGSFSCLFWGRWFCQVFLRWQSQLHAQSWSCWFNARSDSFLKSCLPEIIKGGKM